jgi:hypothetical protein
MVNPKIECSMHEITYMNALFSKYVAKSDGQGWNRGELNSSYREMPHRMRIDVW